MADTPNPLRQGPEDYADLGNMLGKVMSILSQRLENMLPCRVVSYDRQANTAVVQILIKIILTASEQSRAQIGPVPVFAAGGGGFVVNFPLKAGDLGWVLANDRDISAFMESLSEGAPSTFRTHSFNDAVLFPDAIRNFDTSGEDGRMVIQALDGSTRISLGADSVLVKHPTLVKIDAPNAEFTGNVSVAQTLTAQTDVIGGGVSLKNHTHKGVQPGSGNTGTPN